MITDYKAIMLNQQTGSEVINTNANIESLYAVHPKQVIYFSYHFIINNNVPIIIVNNQQICS